MSDREARPKTSRDRQVVSGRELERKRRKVARLTEGLGWESGWFVDSGLAESIVSLFPRIHLRPEFRLVTIIRRDGIGGSGWTFALPADAAPPSANAFESNVLTPPKPPEGALADFMDAIEGDGSLRSYVSASIVRRELDELGAWWHGIQWGTHEIFTDPADGNAGDSSAGWSWTDDEFVDRTPVAVRDGSTITVTFWTSSLLERARVVRHVDLYEEGSLPVLGSDELTVATACGGFIF
jgi:hypothetical protein